MYTMLEEEKAQEPDTEDTKMEMLGKMGREQCAKGFLQIKHD